MNLQARAALFARYLTTNQTPGERQGITVKTDDAPEWVTEVIHAAHGDSFPDDWTYATIREAADAIEESGEDAELEPEIYTAQLLEWLREYPNATGYCDDAVTEYGTDYSGGIISVIQMGQAIAQAEIVHAVIAALESADLDDENDDRG
jgi:hypothetical protein